MLTSDSEVPGVSETSVGPDLLQSLDVVSELLVDNVGNNVQVLTVSDILSPVEEPGGDLELSRVLHDGDNSLELIGIELSGSGESKRKRKRKRKMGSGVSLWVPSKSFLPFPSLHPSSNPP